MTWKVAYGSEVVHLYANGRSLCGVVPRSRTAEWGWQPARECRRCVRSVAKYEPDEPTTQSFEITAITRAFVIARDEAQAYDMARAMLRGETIEAVEPPQSIIGAAELPYKLRKKVTP